MISQKEVGWSRLVEMADRRTDPVSTLVNDSEARRLIQAYLINDGIVTKFYYSKTQTLSKQ